MQSRINTYASIIIPVIVCLFMCVQCSDDPTAPEPPPTGVSKVIDEDGGRVSLGAEAWVIIPPGALDGPMTVGITRTKDPADLPDHYVLGSSYIFTPDDHTFNEPVTIGVAYDEKVKDPRMVWRDSIVDTSWAFAVDATCDRGEATCTSFTLGVTGVADYLPNTKIYVSSGATGADPAGTKDDPIPTIGAGIDSALAAGAPWPPVYVAAGTYAEPITFVQGVSIRGGLDPDTWAESDTAFSTVNLGASAAYANGITELTLISGIELKAPDATDPSKNSVALHLVSCNAALQFERCRFQAGKGFHGLPGQSSTVTAGDGTNGSNGYLGSGGAGGTGCHSGGRGASSDAFDYCGDPGAGPKGGNGPCNALNDGGDGGNGDDGANGSGGGHGTAKEQGWIPRAGANGRAGQCGSGGGGGGTGLIGSGGGGGGGAHAGGAGTGGGGGGATFALYLYDSFPVIDNCDFVSGDGGAGAAGGGGTSGGKGGDGGSGVWLLGGNGGDGGDGGDGGAGQGGAGGLSYCVYLAGAASQKVILTNCVFTVGTPGNGGAGGIAGNGTIAPRGADGVSGEVGP